MKEGDVKDLAYRSCMAAVKAWSEKWVYAEGINFLCEDKMTVRYTYTLNCNYRVVQNNVENDFR